MGSVGSPSASWRTLCMAMAALLAAGALVQYNDPDPVRWTAMYGAAAWISFVAGCRGRVARFWPAAIGVIAAGWGSSVVAVDGSPLGAYLSMFDRWEMTSAAIEVTREATGLLLIAAWMGVVTWRSAQDREWSPQGSAGAAE